MPDQHARFARYAWGVVGYMLAVILWGAFVRATGSGAGCGSHWPLCNGVVVPQSPKIETLIELSHRLTSALAGFFVIGLAWWAFRKYPRGHRVRAGAFGSLVFVITEGAVGAVIVLFEWVAFNASAVRTFSTVVHLVNTFILVAFLTLTAWWAMGHEKPSLRGHGRTGVLLAASLVTMLVVSAAGAVTALGDTLFRVAGTGEALARASESTAHFLERLRIYHPALALGFGVLLVATVLYVQRRHASARVQTLGQVALGLYLAQVAAGAWTIFLKAPVWMQLVHLLTADLLWIVFLLFCNEALLSPTTPDGLRASLHDPMARRAALDHTRQAPPPAVLSFAPFLRRRYLAARQRVRVLDRALPDPAAHFEALTGHRFPTS